MCVNPIVLFQKKEPDGKKRCSYAFEFQPENHSIRHFRRLAFKRSTRELGKYIVVGCGKCVDCLRSRINEWKTRLFHHLLENPKCIFLTLTYDDEHQFDPVTGLPTLDLDYTHFQDFMRRLRRKFPNAQISYFCTGEYGVATLRRHFHALIFGVDKKDLDGKFFCVSRRDNNIKEYISHILTKIWPHGYHFFSSVNVTDSRCIGYVTGYMYAKMSEKHMNDVRLNRSVPEFHHMSLKNPIGKSYFLKNYKRIFQNGFCFAAGKHCSIPRAYIKWFKQLTSSFKFTPFCLPRRFVKKCEDVVNGIDSFSDSSVFDLEDYMENLYDSKHFFIDIKTEYDIIKSRRVFEFFKAASTGKITRYKFESKRINLLSSFKFVRD